MKRSVKVLAFAVTAVPVFVFLYKCFWHFLDGAQAVGDMPIEANTVRPSIIFGLIGTACYGIAFFMVIGLIEYQKKADTKRSSNES